MATVGSATARSCRVNPPLYDARYEHDACGVGFVADAGGAAHDRVLPFALNGLGALGHRGALGADGASADGAGILLPLELEVVRALVGSTAGQRRTSRPGVISLFLPRGRAGERLGRAVVDASLAAEGLAAGTWRPVPVEAAVLGRSAAASRPTVMHVSVPRPRRATDAAFDGALVRARRRMERSARSEGLVGFSVASASARTIVYKGLVAGGRLAELYPDLAQPLPVSHAVFHQRFATNTMPTWSLAQPFRLLAHNGEINTVRGNREQVRGRAAEAAHSVTARRLRAAGPLLSPDGSDSASLDEAVELLVQTGWSLPAALRALLPDAPGLRRGPRAGAEPRPTDSASSLAPWDGPAAIVFSDGRRVGGILDRNGLRPLAYTVTNERLVAAASEAGAFDLPASSVVRRGRLGPGEMLVVEPIAGLIHLPAEAESAVAAPNAARVAVASSQPATDRGPVDRLAADEAGGPTADRPRTAAGLRFLAGLDAERYRLDIRTMVLEGHEPLWSMGDDTPTPARALTDRPVTDHLRQAFAQVTNPPIDAERERAVVDCRVELGPRTSMFDGPTSGSTRSRRSASVRGPWLERPFVADLDALLEVSPVRTRRLDATWSRSAGPDGLETALEQLAARAVASARRGVGLLVLSDARFSLDRLPVPSVLAVGAVHAALTAAGLRGRTDIVLDAADVLDVHAAAMALAAGAGAVRPRLAIELALELAGTRGAETMSGGDAVARLLDAFEAGLRKTLARMGISSAASYVGGVQFEALELAAAVVARCFPAAAAWPGGLGFADLAGRQLRRAEAARAMAPETPPGRMVDPGRARFRADGEAHRYAPSAVQLLQHAAGAEGEPGDEAWTGRPLLPLTLAAPATIRDALRIRRRRTVPLAEVEPVQAIVARFVAAAMSVGALSPEAHQAVTIGMQRAGGAANTGEGGEDPAWYAPGPDGERRDARIKQVASARFGVTTEYLVRAEQLEIKIAQGSKPGEGGQLPGRKATAYIAALRRGQEGMAYISPPPHHDIYSIEDLAQLVADLRAVNPSARIGVKLVASRGIGTIAAGVVKSGAAYVHVAGHAGGTGASPLSSIKHVGAPWELGLAEVHQVLLRADLRDRAVLRTDGGLRTGRDIVIAALLGAEEYALGTALLVALGCDMARQCHLDTCPTGIATQRDDLRAKFRGSPEQVERFVLALAEDVRHELAAMGARTLGELVGEAARFLAPAPSVAPHPATIDTASLLGSPRWPAGPARRSAPAAAAGSNVVAAASAVEANLLRAPERLHHGSTIEVRLTTAERAFGAGLAGAIVRGEIPGPLRIVARGAAGQSLGAFLAAGIAIELEGVANDYVAKGLSGGTVIVRPEAGLAVPAAGQAIAGNTCLYGATAGRLHLVGRVGMRFAVRNSGAEAVVEGLGPHGCEYMTGGTVVVLGPIGPNFGAGMTGGRAFLLDPRGHHASRLDGRSVTAERLADAIQGRDDAHLLIGDLRRLLTAHAAAGSALADALLQMGGPAPRDVWVVEPMASVATGSQPSRIPTGADGEAGSRVA